MTLLLWVEQRRDDLLLGDRAGQARVGVGDAHALRRGEVAGQGRRGPVGEGALRAVAGPRGAVVELDARPGVGLRLVRVGQAEAARAAVVVPGRFLTGLVAGPRLGDLEGDVERVVAECLVDVGDPVRQALREAGVDG